MKGQTFGILLIFFLSSLSPLLTSVEAENSTGIEILDTAVNPANNHTYHLLSASSWEDAANAARGLNGFLSTVDDAQENQWLFDTFASFDNQSRHLWIGLSDHDEDGYYKWHDGTPFYYNNWGDSQPSEGGDEDYVHIASTNMGNIMPVSWNDLENDPQYFPVYGVVEVGEGADFSLRFNGESDHVVVEDDSGFNFSDTDELYLEAWIYPFTNEGLQFIMMKGDYGWGMYLNGANLSYASEYSLSKHPVSNTSIPTKSWSHVAVSINIGVGGEFFVNGESAGMISAGDANIPLGDFGSNDCFTTGEECDEFYIGRMGAGCDCNYFTGMMDNLSVWVADQLPNSTLELISKWTFPEGEGAVTQDQNSRNGTIIGADWVMPDGTIVTQAIELSNEQDYTIDAAEAGDQLLFYGDIDEMSKEMYFTMFSFGQFGKEPITVDVYMSHESIPSAWDHDEHFVADFSFLFEEWSWPDAGTWWIVLIPSKDVEDLTLQLTWVIADPPPALDDMTELLNSIPVTGQRIDTNRQSSFEDRVLYYYINVTEPLASLSVETYGGTGNINLGLSWSTVPDPFDLFDGNFFEPGGNDEQSSSPNSKTVWSTNGGNNELATLYDLEPGTYYVTAYTFGRSLDYTIRASFAYAPDNIAPEAAIELSPGIAYGPLSGYDGLYQYFKINVANGTERLEVALDKGYGEATLFMQYLQAPDAVNYDHLSGSPGAGDTIGFNEPTPGMWYILVYTEEIFANVMITASFEDRYVWSYDGTPIELFNGEEISGIEAPKGEELFFYVQLDNPGEFLEITTFGGQGQLIIEGEGEQISIDWGDDFDGGGDGRPGGRQMPDVEIISETIIVQSNGDGTLQSLFIQMPSNGRFNITLISKETFSDVTLVAKWEYSDLPPVDPVEPTKPVIVITCDEIAKELLVKTDTNADGVVSLREFEVAAVQDVTFSQIDLNGDGELEYREIEQDVCSCGNELTSTFKQLQSSNLVSLELLSSRSYMNDYQFITMDTNSDGQFDSSEIEIAALICDTTYDAFDGDNDGVPDDEDAFPNDPDESKDTDGDGVGDNADLAPSVANDVIYSAGGVLFVMLIGVLVFFLRSGSSESSGDWDSSDTPTGFDEDMMDQEDKSLPSIDVMPMQQLIPGQMNPFEEYNAAPVRSPTTFDDVSDLFDTPTHQPPPSELMGMIDSNGQEVVEYPAGSGMKWTRTDATQSWNKQ